MVEIGSVPSGTKNPPRNDKESAPCGDISPLFYCSSPADRETLEAFRAGLTSAWLSVNSPEEAKWCETSHPIIYCSVRGLASVLARGYDATGRPSEGQGNCCDLWWVGLD